MKVIAVVGHSNAGKTTLVERLVAALSKRGRVGTVKHIDCDPDLDSEGKDTARHRAAGAVRTHGLAAAEWFGTGEERSLRDALDDLAPDCDYAVVEGYSSLTLPKIALGGVDAEGVRLAAPEADEVAIDDAVAAIESVDPYETLDSLVAGVATAGSGVTATFSGTIRDEEHAQRFEARTTDVREALRARDAVVGVRVHRRSGFVGTDDSRFFVVVRARMREAAFAAAEVAADRLAGEEAD
jgi:molybdopterin synthase catalytic subunit